MRGFGPTTLVWLIPVLFFLPGYAVTRSIETWKRTDMALLEQVYLSIALSVALTPFLGLVLAELSRYSLKKLVLATVAFSVPLLLFSLLKKRKSPRVRAGAGKLWTVFVVSLGILFIVLTARGFENIVAGGDTASYLMRGTSIAKRGTLHLEEPELASLTPGQKRALFGSELDAGAPIPGGLYLENPETGEVGIGYFPYYSVLTAIFLQLLGLKNTLLIMNPFIAMLGLLGIVLLCRRMLGKLPAALAGVLLAINGLFIYFARYTTPEMLVQLLVFLGLLCFYFYYEGGNGLWGILSAFALSMTFTARFDFYYILSPIVIACGLLVAGRLLGGKRWSYIIWFLAPFPLLFAHAVLGQIAFSNRYLLANYRGTLGNRVPAIVAVTIAVFAVTVVGALAYRRLRGRKIVESAGRAAARFWRPAAAALIAALCLFAFYVMPHIDRGVFLTASGKIEPARLGDTFRMIFWYLTQVSFWLFLAGVVLFVLYDLTQGRLLFAIIGLFSTALYTYSHFCQPLHIWVMRRYVVIIVPFVMIIAAYALAKIPLVLKSRWLYSVSAAVFVLLLVLFARYSAIIAPAVEFGGTLEYAERVAEKYGPAIKGGRQVPEPVLLFSGRPAEVYFPELMRYVFNMKSFPCRVTSETAPYLGELVARWTGEGRDVYLISSEETLPRLWAGCWPVYRGSDELHFKRLEVVYDRRPEKVRDYNFHMNTYRLVPQIPPDGYTVDIGSPEDSAFVDGGFHPSWLPGDDRVRWTGEKATLVLPVPGSGNGMEINLRMGLGPRVAADASVPVDVSVDGRKSVRFVVASEGMRNYRFTVGPKDLADPAEASFRLEIAAPAWVLKPREGDPIDVWTFGINLDRVDVEAINRAPSAPSGGTGGEDR